MDMSKAGEARSDQINYVDLGHEGLKEIKVTNAYLVDDGKGGEKAVIEYEGGKGRPYKPSKGMLRLIKHIRGWGEEGDNWVGKSLLLIGNKDVVWAGQAAGGIQVKAMSDIDEKGFSEFIALNGKSKRLYKVEYFKATVAQPTEDDLQWIKMAKEDPKVLDTLTDKNRRAFIESFLN